MPTPLTTEQMNAADAYLQGEVSQADVINYYTSLRSAGVTNGDTGLVNYIDTALGVIQNNTADGMIAAAYSASVAASNGVDMSFGSEGSDANPLALKRKLSWLRPAATGMYITNLDLSAARRGNRNSGLGLGRFSWDPRKS